MEFSYAVKFFRRLKLSLYHGANSNNKIWYVLTCVVYKKQVKGISKERIMLKSLFLSAV